MSFLVLVNNTIPRPNVAGFGGDAVKSISDQFQIETRAEPVVFGSEGVMGSDGGLRVETRTPVLEILDDTLHRAPTVLTVVVSGGWADDDVEFAIDGNPVLTTKLDATGGMAPTSIGVNEAMGAQGSHLLSMTSLTYQAGFAVADTFTIETAPTPAMIVIGSDADPVLVPGAQSPTGVYRWVLQDLHPNGLGSYVMPRNPASMTNPHYTRLLTQEHTTSVRDGKYHVAEVGQGAVEWQFGGFCHTQEFYDKLVAYYELPRRFYVIDHRNRAWTVVFTSLDFKARLRTNVDGSITDWAHDYQVSALIYDQDWKVPQ